jgi:hypothetical protein
MNSKTTTLILGLPILFFFGIKNNIPSTFKSDQNKHSEKNIRIPKPGLVPGYIITKIQVSWRLRMQR